MTTLTQTPQSVAAPADPGRTRRRLRRIPLYAGVTVLLVVMVYPLIWLWAMGPVLCARWGPRAGASSA